MAIRLQESLRGLFYAPFYAALARKAYEAEGVDVRFVSSPRPSDAAAAIMTGAADVCWGGPMRVMQTYHSDPACDLISFAEVVTRDPFMLVGRTPRPDFDLRDLASLTLATVSEVPTPWMCLQEDLRRAGMNPDDLTRLPNNTMAENCAALARGDVDVIQLFEPFVSTLEAAGQGSVWYAAANRGHTSYTTFYSRRGLLMERRDELLRMVRAIARTLIWVQSADPAEIAETIRLYFPDAPADSLTQSCRRYKALRIWGIDTVLPREGYDRLRASLVSGRFVNPGAPFEVAVDNSLAEIVRAELQGSQR
ncbi:MAG: ABC transporter substrate-binding protein [Acetobacteraceae bacterium]